MQQQIIQAVNDMQLHVESDSDNVLIPANVFQESKPKQYFIYHPDNELTFYNDETEQLAKAAEIIQQFLDDDGWHPDVKKVLCGTVTHIVEEFDLKKRPDDLDEDECDEDGTYWGNWEEICNYKLKAISTKGENDERP